MLAGGSVLFRRASPGRRRGLAIRQPPNGYAHGMSHPENTDAGADAEQDDQETQGKRTVDTPPEHSGKLAGPGPARDQNEDPDT